MKTIFYYQRDDRNRPAVTICILYDPRSREFAKGVSVCSERDMPNKRKGRQIAEGRARKSLYRKMSYYTKAGDLNFYSGEYLPRFTDFEQYLISRNPGIPESQKESPARLAENIGLRIPEKDGIPMFEICPSGWRGKWEIGPCIPLKL